MTYDDNPQAPVDQVPAVGGEASLLAQLADLEAKYAAAQAANAANAAPATGGPVSPGDVVLHDVDVSYGEGTRTQALLVIGSKSVRVNPDDPDDTRRATKVHAVPIGWVDELHELPKTLPVPVVKAKQFAELSQASYRRQ